MDLMRGLDTSMPRRLIVESIPRTARPLDITVIAEGIEEIGEYEALRSLSVRPDQSGWINAQSIEISGGYII